MISALMDSRCSGLPVTRRMTSSPSASTKHSRSWPTISSPGSYNTAAVGGAGRGGLRRAPLALASAHIWAYSASAASRSSCGTGRAAATASRTPCMTSGSVTAMALFARTSRARTVSRSGLPGPAPTKTILPNWVSGAALLIKFFSKFGRAAPRTDMIACGVVPRAGGG